MGEGVEPDVAGEGPQQRGGALPDPADRLRALFDRHYDFVWRSVRRLGVPPGSVDDAAQEVFVIASRKLEQIQAERERSFLFGVAMRVASDARKAAGRRAEVGDETALEATLDPSPSPEDLADQSRARQLLDRLIEAMPLDARAVFILYELEGLSMIEISRALELPPGTVASRLRRAREHFEVRVRQLRARLDGGAP